MPRSRRGQRQLPGRRRLSRYRQRWRVACSTSPTNAPPKPRRSTALPMTTKLRRHRAPISRRSRTVQGRLRGGRDVCVRPRRIDQRSRRRWSQIHRSGRAGHTDDREAKAFAMPTQEMFRRSRWTVARTRGGGAPGADRAGIPTNRIVIDSSGGEQPSPTTRRRRPAREPASRSNCSLRGGRLSAVRTDPIFLLGSFSVFVVLCVSMNRSSMNRSSMNRSSTVALR